MTGLHQFPFALTKTQRQALRDCAKLLFSGGNPASDDELKAEWQTWRFFFDTALFCLDARYGNWLFCPLGETPALMGAKSFEAYELIRALFREKIDREMNNAFSRIKH